MQHARVGEGEGRAANHEVPAVKQVKVEVTRAVAGSRRGPPGFALGRLQVREQVCGGETRLDFRCGIEKDRRPRRAIERFRFVKGGKERGSRGLVERQQEKARGGKGGRPVPEV